MCFTQCFHTHVDTFVHVITTVQSTHEPLPHVHFESMRNKDGYRNAMPRCSLGLSWIGHSFTSFQFHFHSFGFWFHQEANNCDAFWMRKDEKLAKAQLSTSPPPTRTNLNWPSRGKPREWLPPGLETVHWKLFQPSWSRMPFSVCDCKGWIVEMETL